MKILQRIQPGGAWGDVRYFFGRIRQPHQLLFLLLAITVTAVTLWAFWRDSKFKKPYHRDIVYVQQWRLDRTDAEIIAQQKIDGPKEAARKAEVERQEEERRRFFAKLKKKTDGWL